MVFYEITSYYTSMIHLLETVIDYWGLPQKQIMRIQNFTLSIEWVYHGFGGANRFVVHGVTGHFQMTKIAIIVLLARLFLS